ncbi:MAG: GDP-mannose 4,6-dehydratase [bacterium]
MKALITGITGFVGSHLAEHLLERGCEVYGIRRRRSPLENISHILGRITLIECELRDLVSVKATLAHVRPDYIFHLAAQSFVPTSWTSPADTLNNNIIGQLNVLEAMKAHGLTETRLQIAGSSEEYGMVYENELPIRETNPLRPLSPYGVSKVAQDLLGYQYHHSYGLKTIRTRAFNHTGPRRDEMFATSNFARQIARIEKGLQPPVIKVGNLKAKRDFTDVRDVVRAYHSITVNGEPGEVYNIASGRTYPIGEVLDILLTMTDAEIKVEVDPLRLRPSDVPVLLGDAGKLKAAVGWERKIQFERTMKDLLDYWRERTSA